MRYIKTINHEIYIVYIHIEDTYIVIIIISIIVHLYIYINHEIYKNNKS
jgi:hypothetical protein